MVAGADTWFRYAKEEIKVSKTLKDGAYPRSAYFHAGQAVEFALKAIFLKRRNLQNMPSTCKGAAWHSLPLIAGQAGMDQDIENLKKASRVQFSNWLAAREWQSNDRFPGSSVPKDELDELFYAVSHSKEGVMLWLENLFQKT